MMAPHYERAHMLGAAIHAGTNVLNEPIDRVEVTNGLVVVWSGRRRVAMRYWYHQHHDEHGNALVGSGDWEVQVVKEPVASGMPLLQRLFGRKQA